MASKDWGESYENEKKKLTRGQKSILHTNPIVVKTKEQRELEKFYHAFVRKNWNREVKETLSDCEENNLTFIQAQHKLLTDHYKNIWQLKKYLLEYDPDMADKTSGAFDCELDGYTICRMRWSSAEKLSMTDTINMTVKWNPDTAYERTENWLLKTREFKSKTAKLLHSTRPKTPQSLSFVSHDMSNTFSISASQCRTDALVSMRALLDTLTA